MFDLLLALYLGSLPIPALIWLAAFIERKRLYRNILQEELVAAKQRGRSWKRRILR